MSTIDIPTLSDGDNLLPVNEDAMEVIAGALNTLDGANLIAGSVANAGLGKPKGFWPITFNRDTALTTANVPSLFGVVLPNVDGAVNATYKFLGSSVNFGALTKQPNAAFVIRKGAATILTVDLNDATLAVGTPLASAPGAAVSASSGDKIMVDYTAVASASYAFTSLTLFFSINHVGT